MQRSTWPPEPDHPAGGNSLLMDDAEPSVPPRLILDCEHGEFRVKRGGPAPAFPEPPRPAPAEPAAISDVVAVVGDLSHDIKNMITPTLGGIFTLQALIEDLFDSLAQLRECPVSEDLRERFERSVDSLRTWSPELCEMVTCGVEAVQKRTQQIVQVMTGTLPAPEFQTVQVMDIIRRVLRHLQPAAHHACVELVVDAPDEPPLVEADPFHLYNALFNLVNNALPEVPPGGRVTIRVAAEERAGALQIAVADTGRGIAPERLPALLDGQGESTKKGGSGLGLRIVRKVADAHGGRMDAGSVMGQGTTFTLTLPLRRASG